MHYVICYDLENDRLRARVAKLLLRKGCSRVQRSVFVAPDYDRRSYQALTAALRGLINRHAQSPADTILLVPLQQGDAAKLTVLGANTVHPVLAPPPLKIIL